MADTVKFRPEPEKTAFQRSAAEVRRNIAALPNPVDAIRPEGGFVAGLRRAGLAPPKEGFGEMVPYGANGNAYGIKDYAANSINAGGGFMPLSPQTQVAAGVAPAEVLPQGFRPVNTPAVVAPARPATMSAPAQGNVEDVLGTGLDGQTAAGGFRTIRRPGVNPLLTNVGNPLDPARAGGQFVRDDQTGATRVLQNDFATEGYTQGLRGEVAGIPRVAGGFRGAVSASGAGVLRTETPAGAPGRNRFYNEDEFRPSAQGDASLNSLGARMASAAPRAKQTIYDDLVAQGVPEADAADQAILDYRAQNGDARGVRNTLTIRSSLTKNANDTLTAENGRINAEAATRNAGVAGLKAMAEIRKINKEVEGGGKFTLSAARPDPNGLPYKDPMTGETKFPMLPGSVKIGDTEVPFAEEDTAAAQAQAQDYIARYRQAYPNATETPETMFNKFYQQAVLDVLGARIGGAQ